MSLTDLNDGHLVGFGLVVFGLFFIVIFSVSRRRKLRRFTSGVRTSARVVGVSKFTQEGSTFYRFELEFDGPEGDLVAANTAVARRALVKVGGFDDLIDGSSLGQDVSLPVVYDPDHPKRVDIEAVLNAVRPERGALAFGWVGWVFVSAFVGAGIAFMVIGVGDPICLDPDIGRQGFCDGFGR
jgi:hypothetical protein